MMWMSMKPSFVLSFLLCAAFILRLLNRNIIFSTHPVQAHGVVWKRQEEEEDSFSKFDSKLCVVVFDLSLCSFAPFSQSVCYFGRASS